MSTTPIIDNSGKLSREQVKEVECPACDAHPYEQCIGKRGKPRASCHQERWRLREGRDRI